MSYPAMTGHTIRVTRMDESPTPLNDDDRHSLAEWAAYHHELATTLDMFTPAELRRLHFHRQLAANRGQHGRRWHWPFEDYFAAREQTHG